MKKEKKDKSIRWKVVLDGDEYEIKIDMSPFTGKHKIYVDDEPVPFETPALISLIAGFDQYIKIGDNHLFVTCRGGKLDLSINGIMRSSKEEFVPMPKMEKWMWILCLFLVPLPIVKRDAISALFAVVGIFACIYFAMKPNSEKTRIKMATAAVALPWTILVIFPFFIEFFQKLFSGL